MELMHYGKGHDDNPPGRGSGRYAWGSTKADTKIHEKNKKKLLKNKDYIQYTTNADYRKDALVKKNTKMSRVTKTDEKLDNQRKYVTLSENGWRSYQGDGFLDSFNDAYVKEYETKNPMLIASSKKVIDTILDEYGKENFKKYTGEISEYYYTDFLKDLGISLDKYDLVEADKNNTKQAYNVMKNLYLQGYDAMYDIVDKSIGYSYDDPTIVINPENILKEVETIKIFDKDKGYI